MQKKLRVLGSGLAKQGFPLLGMDTHGTIVVRKRLYRTQVMGFSAQRPRRVLAWRPVAAPLMGCRRFREPGHAVTLMAPQFVTSYRQANKNDLRDAEAIAEAVTRPTMRFVPVKSVDQQLCKHCTGCASG